jgi:hypothetical protein
MSGLRFAALNLQSRRLNFTSPSERSDRNVLHSSAGLVLYNYMFSIRTMFVLGEGECNVHPQGLRIVMTWQYDVATECRLTVRRTSGVGVDRSAPLIIIFSLCVFHSEFRTANAY